MGKNLLVFALIVFSSIGYAEYRDPTEPASYAASKSKFKPSEAITDFMLDAIFVSEDKAVAVVNNQIVKIGDSIGDAKIKSIDLEKVILVTERGEIVLHLLTESVKEPIK